ncbi:MAG: GntR family transcriptional regulator [Firmicutes bacterium]|nr:GntR family transcriptional regulator [Bacillota bacterium]
MYHPTTPIPNTGSLSHSLFNQLRADILQGKLKPGEKLTEQRVCSEYVVSRTPVREAFQKLENDGLIETIPNRGAFVVGVTDRDIQDMYELRKAYEAIAVRWAIQRITDEEFQALQEAYEFMEFYTMKKDIEKMLNINMQFHQLIYNAAHNRMLLHTLTNFQIYTKQRRGNKTYADNYLEEVLSEHQEIFQAFVSKDEDAAAAAITKHLDNAKRRANF